jgi:hypothetical protein
MQVLCSGAFEYRAGTDQALDLGYSFGPFVRPESFAVA